MVRTVAATRYVTPMREGGSLPALLEADDDGMYVVKLRGGGHGTRALVAELAVGELARALGLRVPELVLVQLDEAISRAEPDPEIQELLAASAGLNVGLDFLPGALAFDPVDDGSPDAATAADVVWLDSLVVNIDRATQNPNIVTWHGDAVLIDHGAALYVHSNWHEPEQSARQPFDLVERHVLLDRAESIERADERLAPRVTRELLERVFALVPDDLLVDDVLGREPAATRAAYVDWLCLRTADDVRAVWVARAEQARLAAHAAGGSSAELVRGKRA
jgi:hypothetical protein